MKIQLEDRRSVWESELGKVTAAIKHHESGCGGVNTQVCDQVRATRVEKQNRRQQLRDNLERLLGQPSGVQPATV